MIKRFTTSLQNSFDYRSKSTSMNGLFFFVHHKMDILYNLWNIFQNPKLNSSYRMDTLYPLRKIFQNHKLHSPYKIFAIFKRIFIIKDAKSIEIWIFFCPVGWGCRIHWLHLCRRVRPPTSNECPDMTLNNLMVRFQQCWSFGECGVPLHCHCSQVHSSPEW